MQSNDAVHRGCRDVFETLDKMEDILSKQRYLAGNKLTEADVRAFMTLIRFDEVRSGSLMLPLPVQSPLALGAPVYSAVYSAPTATQLSSRLFPPWRSQATGTTLAPNAALRQGIHPACFLPSTASRAGTLPCKPVGPTLAIALTYIRHVSSGLPPSAPSMLHLLPAHLCWVAAS